MGLSPRQKRLFRAFERAYARLNRREYVPPDPLQFLYRYGCAEDREIAALIASSLAYGRVETILKSVGRVLDAMGDSPRAFVENGSETLWREMFENFRHRFTDGGDLAALLSGVKRVIGESGTLGAFTARSRRERGSLVGALDSLVETLTGGRANSLLSRPAKGSACKRHFLMLRWLVRRDAVDPGGWDTLSPSELLVPLDTHMYGISRALRLTRRASADLKTAREVTGAFARLRPDDPARYDFALTRYGIRRELNESELLKFCEEGSP